jgi:transporter family-2 protein
VSRPSPAVGLALAGGAVFALQNRVNGELGSRAGSPVWAAFVSFASGLVVLAVATAVVPRLRRAVRAAVADRLPWWTYTGGLAGATLVAISAVVVPQVGVATFTVGVVAGQAVGGLLVDRAGLGPGGPQPVSAPRVAGAGLAVLAVLLVRLGHGGGEVSGGLLLVLLVASALGGGWSSLQQALNGRVNQATGEPLLAALGNFALGTAVLAIAVGVLGAAGSGPDRAWPGGPWLYAGGLLGIAYILMAVTTIRRLGVLRLGLLTVAGQLAGGVLLDLASPGKAGAPGLATLAAVLLTLAAVAVAGWRPAHSRSRRRSSASDRTEQTTR